MNSQAPTTDEGHAEGLTVLGPGAVGGLLAAMLQRSGQHVTVVASSTTTEEMVASGLTVMSEALGTWTSRPHVQHRLPAGARVLLTVKAPGLPWSLDQMRDRPPKVILTVLNGLRHVSLLRAALPGTDVIAATITVEATRQTPALIEHRSPFIRLTVPDNALHSITVEDLARAEVDIVGGGTEQEVLWRKFRFLAPMALLTAYFRMPLGEALSADTDLTSSVIGEVAQVATAAGLPTAATDIEAQLRSLPETMRSSVEQDLSAARPTELSALGGDLLAAASEADVRVEACARILARLEAYESFDGMTAW